MIGQRTPGMNLFAVVVCVLLIAIALGAFVIGILIFAITLDVASEQKYGWLTALAGAAPIFFLGSIPFGLAGAIVVVNQHRYEHMERLQVQMGLGRVATPPQGMPIMPYGPPR